MLNQYYCTVHIPIFLWAWARKHFWHYMQAENLRSCKKCEVLFCGEFGNFPTHKEVDLKFFFLSFFFFCGWNHEIPIQPKPEFLILKLLRKGFCSKWAGKNCRISGQLSTASTEEWTNMMHSHKSCHSPFPFKCFCLEKPLNSDCSLLPLPSSHSPLFS